jgi:hypothetical protein
MSAYLATLRREREQRVESEDYDNYYNTLRHVAQWEIMTKQGQNRADSGEWAAGLLSQGDRCAKG